MISFPNAKINIGLNVVSKRDDGFHNIETIFYPVKLYDILEFVEIDKSISTKSKFLQTGIELGIENDINICFKAYSLIANDFSLPLLNIHLHKIIPFGAGLGGGSSDAAFMLKEINNFFNLNLSSYELINYTSKLGSDCAFFINNKPVFAFEKGDKFKSIELNLEGYYILLIKPDIFVSTADAYSGIKAKNSENELIELIKKPIADWKNYIFNDFEIPVFKKFPELKAIKDDLYKSGAIYASMSGSGSSIFGIFDKKPEIPEKYQEYFVYTDEF